MVCVDCLPLLYYLQYLTYEALNNRRKQKIALEKLQKYVLTTDVVFGHSETVLNVLGRCFINEHKNDSAMEVYKLSLEVYPRNNVAHFLLTMLSDPEQTLTDIASNNTGMPEFIEHYPLIKELMDYAFECVLDKLG